MNWYQSEIDHWTKVFEAFQSTFDKETMDYINNLIQNGTTRIENCDNECEDNPGTE